MRLLLIYCLHWTALASAEITFTVEEPQGNQHSASARHLHRVRHNVRDAPTHHQTTIQAASPTQMPVPYRAAASSVTSAHSDVPEQFSLNCPHVADASNPMVRIEVTWTHDDTVWLKIRDGDKRVAAHAMSYTKRSMDGKSVVRATSKDGRYFFDYDELTGDFAMEISPTLPYDDHGLWQCHVTVTQPDGRTDTLTSRSRIKSPPLPPNGAHLVQRKLFTTTQLPYYARDESPDVIAVEEDSRRRRPSGSADGVEDDGDNGRYYPPARIEYGPVLTKTTSFTRPDQQSVEINRDHQRRRQTVVFDRSVTKPAKYPDAEPSNGKSHHHHKHHHAEAHPLSHHAHHQHHQPVASIDYELSMADEDLEAEADSYVRHARTRAAYRSPASPTRSTVTSIVLPLGITALLLL